MKGQGAERWKNETRVLMETRSRRAMPSKKLDQQVNNSLMENQQRQNQLIYLTFICPIVCSQYNPELIKTTLYTYTFKHPI